MNSEKTYVLVPRKNSVVTQFDARLAISQTPRTRRIYVRVVTVCNKRDTKIIIMGRVTTGSLRSNDTNHT